MGMQFEIMSTFKLAYLPVKKIVVFYENTPNHTNLLLCNPRTIITLILKHTSGPKTYQKCMCVYIYLKWGAGGEAALFVHHTIS